MRFLLASVFLSASVSLFGGVFKNVPDFDIRITCPGSIVLGDLNGDGKSDMVVNAWGKGWRANDAKLLLFMNKGAGFAEKPDKVLDFPGCFRMAIRDLDGDGKNDIAVVVGRKVVFLLNKNGFKRSQELSFSNVNQHNADIQICHIKKRNYFDILVGPVWREVLLKKGTFSVRNGYVMGPDINDTWSTLAVDVNADDFMDIVATGRKDNTLRVYYGPMLNSVVDPGKLGEFLKFKVPGTLSSFAVADLNSDGMKDLVASDARKKETHIYFQNQPVGFNPKPTPSATIINAGGLVYALDVNGDKLDDLVVLTGNREVAFFLQKKDGRFPTDAKLANQILKVPPTGQLVFADVDGNGVLDLIAKGTRGSVKIYSGIVDKEK